MGGSASKIGDKELLVIGLDNSGKTTFFKQLSGMLKLTPQEIETAPTIGMNSETIRFRGVKLSVVDMGGRETVRRDIYIFFKERNKKSCFISLGLSLRLSLFEASVHNQMNC
jgi:GTPase SAR1 family protein